MRPVYVREMKELSPALAVGLAFAVITGSSFVGPLSRQFDDMLALSCIGGIALGCLQGGLDRWRRSDLFALHRPVPAARMEAARTLAGITVVAFGLLAFVVTHRIATLAEIAFLARLFGQATEGGGVLLGRHFGQATGGRGVTIVQDIMAPEHLGAREIALFGSFLFAAWAVARFATGAVRLRWVLPALVVTPLLCWSLLARTWTLLGATTLALLLAALFSFGGLLCLAGGRR